MSNIKLELLDLNKYRFDYGYLHNYTYMDEQTGTIDERQKAVRFFTAFRLMFLIDQSHDFLEKEERNKIQVKTMLPIFKTMIKNFFNDVQSYINEVLPGETIKSLNDMDTIEIPSLFFAEKIKFFDLILKYLNVDSYSKLAYTGDKNPLLITGKSNKYVILDELLLRIFSQKTINLEDIFEVNNAPYNCSNNVTYLNNTAVINYNSRYYEYLVPTDNYNIYATVDADKSKYGVSEVTKQACSLQNKNLTFIKTVATNFDSASNSSTEGLLQRISDRNKRQQYKNTGTVNIINDIQDNQKYSYELTILGKTVMKYTYVVKKQQVLMDIADKFIYFVTKIHNQVDNIDFSEHIDMLYGQLSITNPLKQYIKKLFNNLKVFIKGYTFPDESKLIEEGETLHVNEFMKDPPYVVDNFNFNKVEKFTVKEFETLFVGLYRLYKNIEDKISLDLFVGEIFPGYKKIITLDIDQFFYTKKPTGKESFNILINTIKAIPTKSISTVSNEDFTVLMEHIQSKLIKLFSTNTDMKAHKKYFENVKSNKDLQDFVNKILDIKFNISPNRIKNSNTQDKLEMLESITNVIDYIAMNSKLTYSNVYIKLFGKYEFSFNQDNSSVASISENIVENFDNEDNTIIYIMAHKTLGDFGQIVSFYTENPTPDKLETDEMEAGFGAKTRTPEERSDKLKVSKEIKKKEPTVKEVAPKRKTDTGIKGISKKELLENRRKFLESFKVDTCAIPDDRLIRDPDFSNNIIPMNKLKFFITFDRVCSRISSIFNHGTIYESVGLSLSPLQMFDNICMLNSSETVAETELFIQALSK